MGGVGFTELLLLAVVALIVLGPERLPALARTAGRLTRQARRAWQSLQTELQTELDAEHNRRIMDATAGRDVKPAPTESASAPDREPDDPSSDTAPAEDASDDGATGSDSTPKRDDDAS